MGYSPIYNSSGQHIGYVGDSNGGGSPPPVFTIAKLLQSVVISLTILVVIFCLRQFGMEAGVFNGVNLENVLQRFSTLAASCGIVTVSYLVSPDDYYMDIAKKAVVASIFVPVLVLCNMLVGGIAKAIVWLFSIVFIAFGALPALLMRYVLLPLCAVPDDVLIRLLLIFVSGLVSGVLYILFFEFVWPEIRYAFSRLFR